MLKRQDSPRFNRFISLSYTRKDYHAALSSHPNSVVMLHDEDHRLVWSYDEGATVIHQIFSDRFHYYNRAAKSGITFPDGEWRHIVNALMSAGYTCTGCGPTGDKLLDSIDKERHQ